MLNALLNKTATIERNTPATSATGTQTAQWTTVATNVPCALQARRGDTRPGPIGQELDADFLAWFPAGTDLRPQAAGGAMDRVTIEGATYLVRIVADVAGRGKLLAAYLKREA